MLVHFPYSLSVVVFIFLCLCFLKSLAHWTSHDRTAVFIWHWKLLQSNHSLSCCTKWMHSDWLNHPHACPFSLSWLAFWVTNGAARYMFDQSSVAIFQAVDRTRLIRSESVHSQRPFIHPGKLLRTKALTMHAAPSERWYPRSLWHQNFLGGYKFHMWKCV